MHTFISFIVVYRPNELSDWYEINLIRLLMYYMDAVRMEYM